MQHAARKRSMPRYLAGTLVLWLAAGAAFAQDLSPDSGRAVHAVQLTLSAFGAYDGDLADTWALSQKDASGAFTGIDMGFSHRRSSRRVTFGWSGGSSLRHYPQPERFTSASHRAGAGLGVQLGRRGRLGLAGSATRTPYHLLALFPTLNPPMSPGEVAPASDDFRVSTQMLVAYEATARLSYMLGRHSSVEAFSGFRHANPQETSQGYLTTRNFGGRFSRQLTRDAAFRLGYTLGTGDYARAVGRLTTTHDVDLGIDYRRALSRSGRTTMSFTSGAAIVDHRDERAYRLTGAITLSHAIGRTWVARVAYDRGLRLVEGLSEPSFGDAVSADLGGNLGRRTDVRLAVNYAGGDLGLGPGAQAHGTYAADLMVRRVLTRSLGTYARYTYYRFRLGDGTALPSGLAADVERHGAQAGLRWSVPLTRERR